MTPEPVPTPRPVPLAILRGRRGGRVLEAPSVVAERVCAQLGVAFSAIAGPERTRHVATARRSVALALRARTAMSYAEIGAFLGGRNFSTVRDMIKGRRG